MNGIYLGIGGNVGNRKENLSKARQLIAEYFGEIKSASSIYQTAAWGKTDQQDFYNQVLFVKTKLASEQCMKNCLEIENQLGRKRTDKWSSRTIDIDILFYNSEIINKPNLKIPHPFIQERNFVLAPLAEIAPYFIHPVLRKRIKTLLKNTPDKLSVKKVD